MPILNTIKLLGSVLDASAFMPPKQIFSILGSPKDLIPPYPPYSEYNFFNPKEITRLLAYIEEISLLPIPIPYHYLCWLPIPETLFLKETHVYSYPEDSTEHDRKYPTEAWFFVNGIATNLDLALINCQYLNKLFHRRIIGIQNPTDSILVDLLECAVGKRWRRSMNPSRKALEPISLALNNSDIERVILIGHSQGTIIAANILRALTDDVEHQYIQSLELLKKLEIYAFANCADDMRYLNNVRSQRDQSVPYIENFANENDLVARLGMLSPRKELWDIHIDGDMYFRKGGWGHLLNAHYLNGFDTSRSDYSPFKCLGKNGATSRLFGYLDGCTPIHY
jgi:pimeloyl-ACP methyl ester carboxylesterase